MNKPYIKERKLMELIKKQQFGKVSHATSDRLESQIVAMATASEIAAAYAKVEDEMISRSMILMMMYRGSAV